MAYKAYGGDKMGSPLTQKEDRQKTLDKLGDKYYKQYQDKLKTSTDSIQDVESKERQKAIADEIARLKALQK